MEKPEKTFRTGVVSASVWNNQGVKDETGEPYEFKSVSFERRYVDKDGSWKSTSSLRLGDLPKAALVLRKAYEYLVLGPQ